MTGILLPCRLHLRRSHERHHKMADIRVCSALQHADVVFRRDHRRNLLRERKRRAGLLGFVELAILQSRRHQNFAQNQPLGHLSGAGQQRFLRRQFFDEIKRLLVAPSACG